MKRALIGLVAAALALGGCAASIMNSFVGDPLATVMVKYGPPTNAFDMGDGRRAFQWVMHRSFTMPTNSYTTGTAIPIGNTVMWQQNTRITGGQPINSSCAYTLYGRWSDSANTWMIEGYEKPRMMC